MNIKTPYLTWIWRHIAFQMPSSWEMLQFSTEYNRGRCAFADRHQFRAELSWNIVKGEPDYERMVGNYMSKLEQERKLTDAERQKKAGWHGFTGTINRDTTSRFGNYLPGLNCLVEWAFVWPGERDAVIESDVLASTHSAIETNAATHHWRAFGMDMCVPCDGAIEGCNVQPAKVDFSFTDPKTKNTWHMSRMGMVNLWMKISVEEWLKKQIKNNTRNLMTTHRNNRGTEVVHMEGEFKPEGMHLKWGNIEATAWIDRTDERLYHCRKLIRKADPARDVPIEKLLAAAPEFTKT